MEENKNKYEKSNAALVVLLLNRKVVETGSLSLSLYRIDKPECELETSESVPKSVEGWLFVLMGHVYLSMTHFSSDIIWLWQENKRPDAEL